jgi:hypothetical protein
MNGRFDGRRRRDAPFAADSGVPPNPPRRTMNVWLQTIE